MRDACQLYLSLLIGKRFLCDCCSHFCLPMLIMISYLTYVFFNLFFGNRVSTMLVKMKFIISFLSLDVKIFSLIFLLVAHPHLHG